MTTKIDGSQLWPTPFILSSPFALLRGLPPFGTSDPGSHSRHFFPSRLSGASLPVFFIAVVVFPRRLVRSDTFDKFIIKISTNEKYLPLHFVVVVVVVVVWRSGTGIGARQQQQPLRTQPAPKWRRIGTWSAHKPRFPRHSRGGGSRRSARSAWRWWETRNYIPPINTTVKTCSGVHEKRRTNGATLFAMWKLKRSY